MEVVTDDTQPQQQSTAPNDGLVILDEPINDTNNNNENPENSQNQITDSILKTSDENTANNDENPEDTENPEEVDPLALVDEGMKQKHALLELNAQNKKKKKNLRCTLYKLFLFYFI